MLFSHVAESWKSTHTRNLWFGTPELLPETGVLTNEKPRKNYTLTDGPPSLLVRWEHTYMIPYRVFGLSVLPPINKPLVHSPLELLFPPQTCADQFLSYPMQKWATLKSHMYHSAIYIKRFVGQSICDVLFVKHFFLTGEGDKHFYKVRGTNILCCRWWWPRWILGAHRAQKF